MKTYADIIQTAITLIFGTFGIAALICDTVATGEAQTPVSQTGTLTAPTSIPLVLNGKPVGSTTLPAGTNVKVLREEADKTLIATSGGQAWVESGVVKTGNPQQATPVTGPTTTSTEPAAPGARQRPKKMLLVASGWLLQSDRALIADLKENGIEVELAGATGHGVNNKIFHEMEYEKGTLKPSRVENGTGNNELDVSIGEPNNERKEFLRAGSRLWEPMMANGYDGFIFVGNRRGEPAVEAAKKTMCQTGKLVVFAEEITPEEQKADADLEATCHPQINGELPKEKKAELQRAAEWARNKGRAIDRILPLSLSSEPHRIYYHVYVHSTRPGVTVPNDAAMETFVKRTLLPKILSGL